jgi:ABC-type multidrug transport system permease subunit
MLTSYVRLYYLDPFNYLFGAFLTFTTSSVDINCEQGELAVFDPPANETCGEYLSTYQQGMGRGTNLLNPGAVENCEVCRYTTGQDYLKTLNLNEEYYGWRNAGLVVLWTGVFYALVFLMMKLRTKATKRASA